MQKLKQWYAELQRHFKFNPSDLADNVRRASEQWRVRLRYLEENDPDQFKYVMKLIDMGHVIPFEKPPTKFCRNRNPPSLQSDRDRAWEAIRGDIEHGAIEPVNLARDGMPHCLCPVRTADKASGKARFVHNSRHVNKTIPKTESECTLESLLKTRNMYSKGGYVVGSDFASGYHCLFMEESQRSFLAFALHRSEIPEEAFQWLMDNFPEAFHAKKRSFFFRYRALPFGLATSCKAFNSLIAALMGFWRKCPSGGRPTRVSNYIDDVLSAQKDFDSALKMSIRIVYESAALGLSLRIEKCSFFPRKAIKALGTIIDLRSFTFRVAPSRAEKIQTSMNNLKAAIAKNHDKVPTKLIASFIGLVWSIATCCHRAASVMVRAISDTLAQGLRYDMKSPSIPLRLILTRFWSGTVKWSQAAQRQLDFWSKVNFLELEAPISADVLGKSLEAVFTRPDIIDHSQVTCLFQDASKTASGGGKLRRGKHSMQPLRELYLTMFSSAETE